MSGSEPRRLHLQLWTVRTELAADFAGTVQRLAELGLDGVEPFNSQQLPFEQQAQLIRAAGLQIPAAHLPLPHGDRLEESLDAARALGVTWLVSGFGPEDFKDAQDVTRAAERANEASAAAAGAGFSFALHNHWWEFNSHPGVFESLLKQLNDDVHLELDTYWARVAGRDPVRLLTELAERIPLVHLKDGPAVQDKPMLALGDGDMDMPAILDAAARATWIIELDEYDGDMLVAVADSVRYLRAQERNGHA